MFSHVTAHNTVMSIYIYIYILMLEYIYIYTYTIYSNVKILHLLTRCISCNSHSKKLLFFRTAIKSTGSYKGKDRRFLRGYKSILIFLGQLELVHIRTYLLNECKASLNTESADNIYGQSLLIFT